MSCLNPIRVKSKKQEVYFVGCGKCYKCQASRQKQWVFRLSQELQDAQSAQFVTLTYSDDEVTYMDDKQILWKPDLQKFIKRIRNSQLRHYKKEYNLKSIKHAQKKAPQIRYFAVGEYGKQTLRPHYHVIIFNYPHSKRGDIVDIWGKGHVDIGTVNQKSIVYTTKYVLKDSKHATEYFPQFNTMSRRPPIGHSYIRKNAKYHLEHNDILVKDSNGNLMLMPKYYREKIFGKTLTKKLLYLHFKEYQKNLDKEEKRLKELGNQIGEIEYSIILDGERRRNNKLKTEKI